MELKNVPKSGWQNMKKIWKSNQSVVLLRSNPVNPDSRVEKEANSLIKAGYKVHILAWDRDNKYSEQESSLHLKNGSVKITRFGIKATFGEGFKNLNAFLLFQYKIFKWLITNRDEYRIIHACDFDTAFTARKAASFLNKKLVFDIFDYLSTQPKTFLQHRIKKLEDRIINKADAVIICSEKRKEQIKGTKPKRIAVIHNSPEKENLESISDANKDYNNKIKIAYVGILQDYRFLIEMAECISKMENIELHIGGFGKYEGYFKKVSSEKENIYFYGKLSYKETLKLEQECDIMTAIYEPKIGNHHFAAPNKFYEALLLGKPLIMVKGTGMSEIVEEQDIGTLMEYSEEGFITSLNKLLDRKKEWPSMSEKMKMLYEEKFSWIQMEERLVDLYKQL